MYSRRSLPVMTMLQLLQTGRQTKVRGVKCGQDEYLPWGETGTVCTALFDLDSEMQLVGRSHALNNNLLDSVLESSKVKSKSTCFRCLSGFDDGYVITSY